MNWNGIVWGEFSVRKCREHDEPYNDLIYAPVTAFLTDEHLACCRRPVNQLTWDRIAAAREEARIYQMRANAENALGYAGPVLGDSVKA